MKLLEGITVLDFCQFLSGPSAAMRLGDLGARVIKIERPGVGDAGRQLTLQNLMADGDAVNFQIINRGKQSYAANLKDPADLERVKKLVAKADVMISNFRPGIMARMGLDYESVKAINPGIVYGTVTGYTVYDLPVAISFVFMAYYAGKRTVEDIKNLKNDADNTEKEENDL